MRSQEDKTWQMQELAEKKTTDVWLQSAFFHPFKLLLETVK